MSVERIWSTLKQLLTLWRSCCWYAWGYIVDRYLQCLYDCLYWHGRYASPDHLAHLQFDYLIYELRREWSSCFQVTRPCAIDSSRRAPRWCNYAINSSRCCRVAGGDMDPFLSTIAKKQNYVTVSMFKSQKNSTFFQAHNRLKDELLFLSYFEANSNVLRTRLDESCALF